MKRRISILWAILILQAIWLSEPKISAEPVVIAEEKDLAETKSGEEIQRIVKVKIEVKTREEEEIIKAMGLKCEWTNNEAICDVTFNQLEQLKQAGLRFQTIKEGIRIESKHLNHTEERGVK
jgi:fibronectin type 3 domain-containing protein